jgi:outer membrane protein OmpA-like peptidoglycan-associated protein
MKFKTMNLIAGFALAAMVGGCATVAPAQVVGARDAYTKASHGLAAKMNPTDLYDAKKALDTANAEFDANGATLAVGDYSYIAQRKVELADVKARTEVDRQEIAGAVKLGVVVRDKQVSRTQLALANSREELKDERTANNLASSELKSANAAQGKELAQTGAQLETEKQARMTAEARLAAAMKDLTTIAAVKDEARGVVITLSGSVLFASGKYELLETAKTKLDQVAEALKAQSDDRKMIVEGHTDSQGSDAINVPLSVNRAKAVRDYLISRGVDANKISAVGMGSGRPLLNNGSAENRANNRRVEIIIQPSPSSRLSAR